MSTNSSKRALRAYAAVDLGASSGRVMIGVLDGGTVRLEEIHRFANAPRTIDGEMAWNLPLLFEETLAGLARAATRCRELGVSLCGIGVDSWGVDWVLLKPDGNVELPGAHYRMAPDPAPMIAEREFDEGQIYALSGIPDQAINTALRLGALRRSRAFDGEMLLFIPDLWAFWLTGQTGTDPSIASTSQLLDVRTGEFAPDLIHAVGASGLTMPDVQSPGTRVGQTSGEITERIGLNEPLQVLRVAGHDTACAFAFAESSEQQVDALVSIGTWSLVGSVIDEPLTGDDARCAGLANERGVDGVLLLRNITGMWMLQECVREWSRGGAVDLPELVANVDRLDYDKRTFDAADLRFFESGHMEQRIRDLCGEVDRPLDESRESVVRAVIDSLAATYTRTIRELEGVTGRQFKRVRIVGGGTRNHPLCKLIATLTGLPVLAGPVEASAIGNIAIQARADGAVTKLSDVYDLLDSEDAIRTFMPRSIEETRQ